MIAFLAGAALAVAQVILLKWLLGALADKKGKKAFWVFVLKFLLYGTAIALFGFRFSDYIENTCYGFIAAFPLAAIVWFVFGMFRVQIEKFFFKILSKIKKPRV